MTTTFRRRGVALLEALVALAVLAILTGTITWQVLANRRVQERRQQQQQAVWLTRAGVELAAARLLEGPDDYPGETMELIPRSQLKITVKRDQDIFRVTSLAHYPTEGKEIVARSLTRTFRLVTAGDKVVLEAVP